MKWEKHINNSMIYVFLYRELLFCEVITARRKYFILHCTIIYLKDPSQKTSSNTREKPRANIVWPMSAYDTQERKI
jgi:hypothetical protein